MKGLVIALVPMAAMAVSDFDDAAWESRNRAMASEAMRMQREYAKYDELVKDPAENVTVPFETFASGEVKATAVARLAQFFHDAGFVWAKDVTVVQYKEDGSTDFHLVADNCLIDRAHKCCWISGHARATHRNTVLEGDDAFYCSSNSFLKVMSNAKVVSEDVKMKGMRL